LGAFPYKGHVGESDAREWVVPKFRSYLLIYDVDPAAGAVTILRVWHQSRQRSGT
jgi:plasmid stabilization system protein ParE